MLATVDVQNVETEITMQDTKCLPGELVIAMRRSLQGEDVPWREGGLVREAGRQRGEVREEGRQKAAPGDGTPSEMLPRPGLRLSTRPGGLQVWNNVYCQMESCSCCLGYCCLRGENE